MTDTTWLGDTCSLVEAFRSGERAPSDELEATLAAVEASELHAFSYVDADGARRAAERAEPSLPFGGVPIGIKELDKVEGWPDTEASLALADRRASYTRTYIQRLVEAGAVPVGLCTASEFGGLNISVSKLNGVTGNPWNPERTAGGSSGGSSAAVAGGLVSIATGGDGGGSIRIPAGFNGLVGMKGTAGRIPRGPHTDIAPLTVVLGCQARSVRDVARFYDVCAGHDPRDPHSLPSAGGWEAGLGSHRLRGRRLAIAPDLGCAVVRPELAELVEESAASLARDTGMELVELPVDLPLLAVEWAMANLCQLLRELGDRWPDCQEDLTPEIAFGLKLADDHYDLRMAARVEEQRIVADEAVADLFEQVDFVVSATNPDVAFPADVSVNTMVGDEQVGVENNGALTSLFNVVGNPAVSVPAGTLDGLPVGVQVVGRHHEDDLLLDLALAAERHRSWPLVAPGAPR